MSLRLEGNSIPVGPSASPIKSTQKINVRVLVLVLIGSATGLLLVLGLVVFLFKRKLGDVQLAVSNSGPSGEMDGKKVAMKRMERM